MQYNLLNKDTIVALASPHGTGAIALLRLSGPQAFAILEKVFFTKDQKPYALKNKKTHTIHYGFICAGGVIVDEVLVSVFKNPHSYTGEDSIEISCHGSQFIQQQIMQLLCRQGARMANPGEFTLRAFLNKKIDLSQSE